MPRPRFRLRSLMWTVAVTAVAFRFGYDTAWRITCSILDVFIPIYSY